MRWKKKDENDAIKKQNFSVVVVVVDEKLSSSTNKYSYKYKYNQQYILYSTTRVVAYLFVALVAR